MQPWRTAITHTDEGHVWIRGYDVTELMAQATFADVVFLLHQGRLPSAGERRLLDAILIAAADHGPGSPSAAAARMVASGNRQSLEAAVAAGILAIGDFHAGAGQACMQLIADGLALAQRESLSLEEAAGRIVAQARTARRRLPGLGHRYHTEDPRTARLFRLAREADLAGDGIAFMEALADAVRVQIKPLPINVDGAIAAVLHDLGFPPPLAKLLFVIGRTAGLTAQIMEEHTREKPMRIHIPIEYDGPEPRTPS